MRPSAARVHPTWEEMQSYLDADAPTLHVIDGAPVVSIFIDPAGPRIGLRAPFAPAEYEPARPLAAIDIRVASSGGARFLELSTGNPSLFPYFYSFALGLADRIQIDALEVPRAVELSLDQWRALLRQAAMLSDEEQTGLMGEMWMLERLVQGHSPAAALAAWTGPRGEAHDFRIGSSEFEIKATRGERRIHLISSMSQLVASPGRALFVVSLQFAEAGAGQGRTLRDGLVRLRGVFEPEGLAEAFDELVLRRYGVSEANRGYYRQPLLLRSKPHLVPVSEDLPSLRQDDILAIPRPGMERVSDVRYRLDVSGLGFPDGSPEFLALLPAPQEETD